MKKLTAVIAFLILSNLYSQTNIVDAKLENGRFYNSIQDYVNNKPANDIEIKNTSEFHFKQGFKLIEKNGEISKVKTSKFTSSFFTYAGEYAEKLDLYRAYDGESYLIITIGNICMYSNRQPTGNGGIKDVLYYSEGGINGEVKKFKEKVLEDWLEKANLLETYNKDKPKREFKDDVSEYYNKEVSRYLKYIDMLNKKK